MVSVIFSRILLEREDLFQMKSTSVDGKVIKIALIPMWLFLDKNNRSHSFTENRVRVPFSQRADNAKNDGISFFLFLSGMRCDSVRHDDEEIYVVVKKTSNVTKN